MPLSANLGKKLRETLNSVRRGTDVRRETSDVRHENPNNTGNSHISLPMAIGTTSHEINIELQILQPLFELQEKLSHVPKANELLVEQIETDDGFHLFVYPFEGRLVHEAMAAILAYRISRIYSLGRDLYSRL